jgi:hypothetical protein
MRISIIAYFISFMCFCVPVGERSQNKWNDGRIGATESLPWDTREPAFNSMDYGFDNWMVNGNGSVIQPTPWSAHGIYLGHYGELNLSKGQPVGKYADITNDPNTLFGSQVSQYDFTFVLILFSIVYLFFTLCICSFDWRFFRYKRKSRRRARHYR